MKTKLEILQQVADGKLTPKDAEAELLVLSFVSGNEGRNKLNLPTIKKPKKPEVAVCRYCKTPLKNPVSIDSGYCDMYCFERQTDR